MASIKHLKLFSFVILVLFYAHKTMGCYNSIFSFGDSLADTGNALYIGSTPGGPVGQLPYGQTYFNQATGRCSDGRLIIDFIAQAIGLPLLRPYLAGGNAKDFEHGANFAVAGATALNNSFFEAKGLQVSWKDYSLRTQIDWFKQLLPSHFSESNTTHMISKSLFLMGEIGGNDYNFAFLQKRSIHDVRTYVPSVINAISWAIIVLIELGAKTLVVPGNFPIGCTPAYLTDFQTTKPEEYDPETGCISWLNELSHYHNSMLLDELNRLRNLYPNTTIVYADYYKATMSILHYPQLFGFKAPLAACCGSDGPYNFNWSKLCGTETAKVCSDPSSSFSWDGMHLTEAAYDTIARSLLEGTHARPSFTETCASFQHNTDI